MPSGAKIAKALKQAVRPSGKHPRCRQLPNKKAACYVHDPSSYSSSSNSQKFGNGQNDN
jgi:hypothetical protein